MKTSYNIPQKERRNIKTKINPYSHQKKDTVDYSLLLLYKEVLDSKVEQRKPCDKALVAEKLAELVDGALDPTMILK